MMNATSTFQLMMDFMLIDRIFALLYLDYFFEFSNTIKEHFTNLRAVFDAI